MKMQKTGRMISLLLTLLLLVGLLPAGAGAESGTPAGSGTETDPYLIADVEDLKWFRDQVNKSRNRSTSTLCADLTCDLTLTDEWTPIGFYSTSGTYVNYGGTFDGLGHTVTFGEGSSIVGSARYGLFGTVTGAVRDLKIDGVIEATGGKNVGGVAGYIDKGTIQQCVNSAAVSAASNIGGIAGYIDNGTIQQCVNSAAVSGTSNIGGIAGYMRYGTLVDCANSGAVTASSGCCGGVVSSLLYPKELSNCCNIGEVTSRTQAGGISGLISIGSGKTFTVKNVYNAGTVSASQKLGSITGNQSDKQVGYENVYFLKQDALPGVGSGASMPSGEPVKLLSEAGLKTAVLALVDDETKAPIFLGSPDGGWPAPAGQASEGSSGDPPLSGDLTVNGRSYVGGELTAVYSGAEEVTYQWYRDGAAIEGATDGAYTAAEADIWKLISVTAFAEGHTPRTAIAGTVPDCVTFAVTPESAAVTVKDSGGQTWTGTAGGVYALPAGDYTYTASVASNSEYPEVEGAFSVPYEEDDGTITVALAVKTYAVTFELTPADMSFTVRQNGKTIEPSSDPRTYQLEKGECTYSASAFGCESQTDVVVTVTGEGTETVTLTSLPIWEVHFQLSASGGVLSDEPTIEVYDADGIARDYTGGLPTGNYTYQVTCSGYQTVAGSFSAADGAVTVPVRLLPPGGWGGTTGARSAGGSDDVSRTEEPTVDRVPFADVSGHWGLEAIQYVYDHGLMEGVGNGEFAPEAPLTRGMLVTILYRMAGSPTSNGEADFRDVTPDVWYAEAVRWAVEHGVVRGFGDGTFRPEQDITREQAAALLRRYADLQKLDTGGTADLSTFRDAASVSAWAESDLAWANAAGLITGQGDHTLAPTASTTRAEAAALLQRFCESIQE